MQKNYFNEPTKTRIVVLLDFPRDVRASRRPSSGVHHHRSAVGVGGGPVFGDRGVRADPGGGPPATGGALRRQQDGGHPAPGLAPLQEHAHAVGGEGKGTVRVAAAFSSFQDVMTQIFQFTKFFFSFTFTFQYYVRLKIVLKNVKIALFFNNR